MEEKHEAQALDRRHETRQSRLFIVLILTLSLVLAGQWVSLLFFPDQFSSRTTHQMSLINALIFSLVLIGIAVCFTLFYIRQRRVTRILKDERDRLHAVEEQNRIMINECGLLLARYDLKTQLYHNQSDILFKQGFGTEIENVPEVFIEMGMVAPECERDFREFYGNLRKGISRTLFVSLLTPDKGFRWFRKDATFVVDAEGKPYQAIVAYKDITEAREKEAVYAKWRQSVLGLDPNRYTLFRCNLSKSSSFDTREGNLLKIQFAPGIDAFNGRTREYAGRFVHLDDYDAYVAMVDSDYLLASYYRGTRVESMKYRELTAPDEYRWLKLTAEMVQHLDSEDIEVFLMYEDIDKQKREELALTERTDIDSLTGVLNRAAFIERFNQMLTTAPDAMHALLLLDIDGFKLLNDTFGHAAGDQALEDIAASLRSVVQGDDLLGRLGGDEFMIALRNVSNQTVVEKKVTQVLALLRRAYSLDVQITASIGVAMFPGDGDSFSSLYRHVDVALYAAKENGRDTYSFYGFSPAPPSTTGGGAAAKPRTARHRMLVVDNDAQLASMVPELFQDRYTIEVCSDETSAMVYLHRYRVTIHAILIALDDPGFDGFSILNRIMKLEELNTIPIIVISEASKRPLCMQAIQSGACEFILRPVAPDLLQIRINSAITKAENERLRAQNTYLQMQNGEKSNYRAVFENTGTIVVEYDMETGQFSYDPEISQYIGGTFDDRSLWHVLLSDMVADAMDVKAMQHMMHDLASKIGQKHSSMDVMLKTPDNVKHWFRMNVFKRVNNLSLTSKIILTFADINEDVVADKKLRFQAEHDRLTGLYNRDAFMSLLEATVRDKPAGSYALFCCDINDFHIINERFGREEGDRLLVYAAEKLRALADSVGGHTGRLSNDIYAMLTPNSSSLLPKAAPIIQGFFSGYPLHAKINCRAGVYIIENPEIPADSMLDRAAIAKDSIKGKYAVLLTVFNERMLDQQKLEKDIADRMENALASGHFQTYIQPQYSHATGKIVGAEVLTRWVDPQTGVISPGVFVPVFERNGFITKMDEYVWEQAAKHFHNWLAKGNRPVPLSVNVSREDIKDPNLCDKLLSIITKYGIPPNLFRLEITESLFTDDSDRLIEVMEQLHAHGFLIEMDDFGSGYSSLNILKDVPVDILKLDMRFFAGNDNLGRGGLIINAVIRMARWLSIPVIAEGVETKAQADFLLSSGCQTIQGYLYARPMPIDAFERELTANLDTQWNAVDQIKTDLDVFAFWDPISNDSQLFDRYIGAAFVFEFRGGEYEILRMNRAFMNIVHLQGDAMLPAHGLIHFYEADRPLFQDAVRRALDADDPSGVEPQCLCRREPDLAPLRVTLRLLAKSRDRALFLCGLQNEEIAK